MEGGFRLAKCHVVAKTQGYQLVFIWGSQIKFQGGWTGLKGPASGATLDVKNFCTSYLSLSNKA